MFWFQIEAVILPCTTVSLTVRKGMKKKRWAEGVGYSSAQTTPTAPVTYHSIILSSCTTPLLLHNQLPPPASSNPISCWQTHWGFACLFWWLARTGRTSQHLTTRKREKHEFIETESRSVKHLGRLSCINKPQILQLLEWLSVGKWLKHTYFQPCTTHQQLTAPHFNQHQILFHHNKKKFSTYNLL